MDVEKAKAGRRVAPLLAAMLPKLIDPPDTLPPALAVGAEDEQNAVQASGRWQEVYYALILVEQMAQHTPRQVCTCIIDILSAGKLAWVKFHAKMRCSEASARESSPPRQRFSQ